MTVPVLCETFASGLTLLVEPVPDVESAALVLLLPGGCGCEPAGLNGLAAATCDWLFRGAGTRDNRALTTALDRLGVQRHEVVNSNHLTFRASFVASQLDEVLPLYADVVRRPLFPEEEFEAVLSGVEGNLRAIEDEPRQKVMIELSRRCFPEPWNRPHDGTLEDLERITPAAARAHAQTWLHPGRAVLAIAGRVDPQQVRSAVARHFGDWSGTPVDRLPQPAAPQPVQHHLLQEAVQTQIGVSFRSVPYAHPDYYTARMAIDILSGGMSSRLMTEVREKRGLCYSVYASLVTAPHLGCVLSYAGTTVDRAQETLDVLLAELTRLPRDLDVAEVARGHARLKSALIMAQESTSARAGALAGNWSLLQQIIPIEQVRKSIDEVSVPMLITHLAEYPPTDFTVVTIGPQALQMPG